MFTVLVIDFNVVMGVIPFIVSSARPVTRLLASIPGII